MGGCGVDICSNKEGNLCLKATVAHCAYGHALVGFGHRVHLLVLYIDVRSVRACTDESLTDDHHCLCICQTAARHCRARFHIF